MGPKHACRVLLIYPRFVAETFWNFAEACELVGARYPTAPLGLITVTAMLPSHWEVRLVDRNTQDLTDADLAWADMVMTGGMLPQQADTLALIELCRRFDLPASGGYRIGADEFGRGQSAPQAIENEKAHPLFDADPSARGAAILQSLGDLRGRPRAQRGNLAHVAPT